MVEEELVAEQAMTALLLGQVLQTRAEIDEGYPEALGRFLDRNVEREKRAERADILFDGGAETASRVFVVPHQKPDAPEEVLGVRVTGIDVARLDERLAGWLDTTVVECHSRFVEERLDPSAVRLGNIVGELALEGRKIFFIDGNGDEKDFGAACARP